ncbi:MAG: hypothetical protein IJR17_04805 [Clostridia bacterium]|nr:hypothetical protein [Clostridia bacterium]
MGNTKIIVIEGIDGTGKTVQLKALHTALMQRGYTVGTLSFPVYESFFGGCVGKFLSKKEGVSAKDVDQKSMALWFAMDRWAAFRGFDYSDFDVLLINRYVLSNAVYQSIRDRDLGCPDILDFVLELEYGQLQLPKPDLQLVLDVDPRCARENVAKKGFRDYVGEQKDEYEQQEAFSCGRGKITLPTAAACPRPPSSPAWRGTGFCPWRSSPSGCSKQCFLFYKQSVKKLRFLTDWFSCCGRGLQPLPIRPRAYRAAMAVRCKIRRACRRILRMGSCPFFPRKLPAGGYTALIQPRCRGRIR